MLRRAKQTIKNSKGMTLLEIMIVLAILGGLITILATQVTKQLGKSRAKQAKIHISQIGNALDMYYTDCGFYPQTLDALWNQSPDCSNWGPDPYLKKPSGDALRDPWNKEYIYEVNGGNYTLMSLGEDGREGGSGNAADISNQD